MGNGEVVDGLIKDGLWDPYNDHHMVFSPYTHVITSHSSLSGCMWREMCHQIQYFQKRTGIFTSHIEDIPIW
jgi:hypothetical protein